MKLSIKMDSFTGTVMLTAENAFEKNIVEQFSKLSNHHVSFAGEYDQHYIYKPEPASICISAVSETSGTK